MLLVISLYSISPAETMHVGFFSIEPHTIIEPSHQYSGAAIEFFSRIADIMDVSSVRFQEFPLARLIRHLEDGDIDVILFLARTPERERIFRYPEKPYLFSQSGLAVTSLSPVQEVSCVKDISALRIGILGKGYLSPFIRNEKLQLYPLYGRKPILRNLKKLINGRIDAIYVPDLNVIQFESWKHGYTAKIRFVPLPEPLTPNYSVFSKKSAEKYLSRYEMALQELQNTFPYKKLLEKYMEITIPD